MIPGKVQVSIVLREVSRGLFIFYTPIYSTKNSICPTLDDINVNVNINEIDDI